jgi:hypothetical protein
VPANEDQINEILGQMADGQKDSSPLKKLVLLPQAILPSLISLGA